MTKFQTGMSRDDVIKVLGRPDSAKLEGTEETYSYNNRMISGWSWDRADYVFRFKDGSLIEYGPKNIVQHKVAPYDPQKDPYAIQRQHSDDQQHELELQLMKDTTALGVAEINSFGTKSSEKRNTDSAPDEWTGQSRVGSDSQMWYQYRTPGGTTYWTPKAPR